MRPVPVPCQCTVSDDVFPVGFDKGFATAAKKFVVKTMPQNHILLALAAPKKVSRTYLLKAFVRTSL